MDADGSIIVGLLGCGVVGGGVADRLLITATTASWPTPISSQLSSGHFWKSPSQRATAPPKSQPDHSKS